MALMSFFVPIDIRTGKKILNQSIRHIFTERYCFYCASSRYLGSNLSWSMLDIRKPELNALSSNLLACLLFNRSI